ncbi:unnamed protein product [Closterium sp. Naga37s-1]|nr:unnamed protein product [Closterium sp. Naga37s-1]
MPPAGAAAAKGAPTSVQPVPVAAINGGPGGGAGGALGTGSGAAGGAALGVAGAGNAVKAPMMVFTPREDVALEDLERILPPLGFGSGGRVYRVRHKKSGKEYALKVIQEKYDEEVRKQIIQEMQILRRARSDHVVECYGIFDHLGEISFVLELMDGGTLADVTKKRGKIPESFMPEVKIANMGVSESWDSKCLTTHNHSPVYALFPLSPTNPLSPPHPSLFSQVKIADFGVSKELASTLAQCNSYVKIADSGGSKELASTLAQCNSYVKIADFGGSKELASTLAQCNSYVGTSAYLSPERINPPPGEGYDGYLSDVWSMGLSLLELLLPLLTHSLLSASGFPPLLPRFFLIGQGGQQQQLQQQQGRVAGSQNAQVQQRQPSQQGQAQGQQGQAAVAGAAGQGEPQRAAPQVPVAGMVLQMPTAGLSRGRNVVLAQPPMRRGAKAGPNQQGTPQQQGQQGQGQPQQQQQQQQQGQVPLPQQQQGYQQIQGQQQVQQVQQQVQQVQQVQQQMQGLKVQGQGQAQVMQQGQVQQQGGGVAQPAPQRQAPQAPQPSQRPGQTLQMQNAVGNMSQPGGQQAIQQISQQPGVMPQSQGQSRAMGAPQGLVQSQPQPQLQMQGMGQYQLQQQQPVVGGQMAGQPQQQYGVQPGVKHYQPNPQMLQQLAAAQQTLPTRK